MLFLAVFASILACGASGQLSTGSIAVFQSADDFLVIAADSKNLSAKGVSLHSCKVDALDDQLLFASTGYGSYAGVRGKWDAIGIARQHYRLLASLPRHELIPKLAEAYAADLASKLEPDVTDHPEEHWPQILLAAVFAGFDEKRERIGLEVKIQRPGGPGHAVGYTTRHMPLSDAEFADVIGETTIAQEFAEGRTLRSQFWRSEANSQVKGLGVRDRLIAGGEKIVELTATYEPSVVGGPIDTVVVSRKTGVDWIRRKPDCAHSRER